MGYAKQWHNYEDITNHNDAKRFESWSIVYYVGESNVKKPSYKKETCSNGQTSKINVKSYRHGICEIMA